MLNELITRASLEEMAGTTAFQRGEAYFADGTVDRLRVTDDKITARVDGSETYQVELSLADDDLAWDCTCPRAADGYFCKHCVAVGLAWLAESSASPKSAEASGKKRPDPWRDITAYLSQQAAESLVELLLEVAQRDDRLYQSLLLKAARSGGAGKAVKAFRRAIDDATCIDRYIDWREARSFSGNIEQVADSLAELLKPESAAALVELAEYAIERIENTLEHIDDSSDDISGIVHGLGELHLKACTLARVDACDLAERLFQLETTLPLGIWSFEVAKYGDVLGKEGLRHYRELAEAEWHKLKPPDAKRGYDYRRAKLTRIMIVLAEVSGDVDELVAIKAQDLSSAFRYLDIAEILSKAGQPEPALAWAERGLEAFPERPDNRLRDFLVAAYLARQRHDEALQLTWIQFEEQPKLDHYEKLHAVAGQLGRWPEQRYRALVRVGEAITQAASETTRWKPQASAPDYSLRLEIALWEQDLEEAWLVAHAGICQRHLLITLAGNLAPSRPIDAICLYRRVVPPIVEQTNNTAYAEATTLIAKVGSLMKAQNQLQAFADYLAALRQQYKAKRNFIKLLDGLMR